MRVLLIYPNIIETPKDISMGLACVSAMLRQKGHEVSLIDTTWGMSNKDIKHHAHNFKPELLCVTVATNDFKYGMSIIDLIKQDNILSIDLKKQVVLSRMSISYVSLSNCTQPVLASVETSKDGTQWTTERDPLNFKQVGEIVASFRPAWDTSKIQIKREPSDSITYYFAGRNAAYLRLKLDDTNSCLLNNPIIFISVLN